MLNDEGVHRRLADMRQYIEELAPIQGRSFEEYEDDYFVRHTAEHLIELIVECGIDINGMLLSGADRRPARTYRGSYLALADLGVVTAERSEKLAELVGMRNRIAHEYEEVSDRLVYDNISRTVELFREYLASVSQHVARQDEAT